MSNYSVQNVTKPNNKQQLVDCGFWLSSVKSTSSKSPDVLMVANLLALLAASKLTYINDLNVYSL